MGVTKHKKLWCQCFCFGSEEGLPGEHLMDLRADSQQTKSWAGSARKKFWRLDSLLRMSLFVCYPGITGSELTWWTSLLLKGNTAEWGLRGKNSPCVSKRARWIQLNGGDTPFFVLCPLSLSKCNMYFFSKKTKQNQHQPDPVLLKSIVVIVQKAHLITLEGSRVVRCTGQWYGKHIWVLFWFLLLTYSVTKDKALHSCFPPVLHPSCSV